MKIEEIRSRCIYLVLRKRRDVKWLDIFLHRKTGCNKTEILSITKIVGVFLKG